MFRWLKNNWILWPQRHTRIINSCLVDMPSWVSNAIIIFGLVILTWVAKISTFFLLKWIEVCLRCRGAVAQSVERPSKGPGRCNSTNVCEFKSRPQHKGGRKNPSASAICGKWKLSIYLRIRTLDLQDGLPVSWPPPMCSWLYSCLGAYYQT